MIRNFRNVDAPALAEIWNDHWSMLGPSPVVTAPMVEQAVLSRTFFDPARLLVAETADGLCGWCHHGLDGEDSKIALITAVCLKPGAEAEGGELIAEALRRIAEDGIRQVRAGALRDRRFGLSGLNPVGHGSGIPDADVRVTSLLSQAGFSAGESATQMVVSTESYRPPVSREALQFRRSTTLSRETRPASDTRLASAMAHLDVECHRLRDRSGKILGELDLWCSDPEAEVMSPHHAIVDFGESLSRGKLEPAESFLLGAVLQSLAARHIHSVETVIDADQTQLRDQLQSLHFRAAESGHVWHKTLA